VRSPFSPLIVASSAPNQDAFWHASMEHPGRQPEEFFVAVLSPGSIVFGAVNTCQRSCPDHLTLRSHPAKLICIVMTTQWAARMLAELRSLLRAGCRRSLARFDSFFQDAGYRQSVLACGSPYVVQKYAGISSFKRWHVGDVDMVPNSFVL
jgi:hypothetical protein